MPYRFVDGITSDVMFEAEGRDLKELLEQASLALFDVVCERKEVQTRESREIEVEEENPEDLLHEWLSELLTESDAEEMFFSKFEVKVKEKNKGFVSKGEAWGEPYSQEKSGTVVKGVTYHKFSVEKTKEGWKAVVVCDI